MSTAAPTGVAGSQAYAPTHTQDTTGQMAPPGMKPKVTATLWEDEGSLCFQVEAKGVCVARREGMFLSILDDHDINDCEENEVETDVITVLIRTSIRYR